METNHQPKTLHALLVAIDNYPIPAHRLNGCVNDRNAFREYLESRFAPLGTVLNIKTLTDAEATKKNIIEAFQHFDAAKDGDICVFYFSGHGSQVQAHQAFWHLAPDKMNESMVCHDSRLPGGKDLMDKELSYLFWKATQHKDTHFLAVFDCCHSGSLSRDISVTPRIVSSSPVPNRLEDYYGYESYQKESENGVLMLTPPRGKIIQFGAAKPYETAKELKINGQPRGIFTYSLIEALQQGGDTLTYADLLNILRIRISNKVNQQSPQLIALPHEKKMRFLGTSLPLIGNTFQINFTNGKWIINAGAIHGLNNSGQELELSSGEKIRVGNIQASNSEVLGMEGKNTSLSYKAYLKNSAFKKLKLGFGPEHEPEGIEFMHCAFEDLKPLFAELVEDPADAEFWIRPINGAYRLTKPLDDRPVFRRVPGYTDDSAKIFLDNVESVAKWQNLLLLTNPKSTIQDHEFKIELFRTTDPGNYENNAPAEAVDWKEEPVFRYEWKDEAWHAPGFKLKVTNTGFRKLFFSAVNLEDNYGITNHFMDIQELNPGEEAWLMDTDPNGITYRVTPLEVDDSYHSWGITEAAEYFKFFISNDPDLNTDVYNQEGLEYDVKDFDQTRAGRKNQSFPMLDWTTREIKLKIVRPMEAVSLTGDQPVSIVEGIEVEGPEGISAEIKLTTLGDSQRAIGGENAALQSLNNISIGERGRLEPLALTLGNKEAQPLSVLELKNVSGQENVTPDTPIKIKTNAILDENSTIIPLGYDEETGLLIPLGFSDNEGNVLVGALPDPNADSERSLGGSVKIFFQKMVFSSIPGGYNYPQLAIAQFEEEGENFAYVKDPILVKGAAASAQSIVLFIHGIIGDTTEMVKSLKRAEVSEGHLLKEKFDLVLTFDYENLSTPIEQTAKDLAAKLEEAGITPETGKDLTIIAHSMGGLVSRWFIEKEGGNAIVNHLIQLGTPNAGSPWSSVYELVSTLLARVVNGAAFLQPYLIPLSFLGRYTKSLFHTLNEMHEETSNFIKTLNDDTDPSVRYSVIAGNTQLIPVEYEEKHNTLLKKLIRRFKKRGAYDALDLFLFKKPNDIAVSTESIVNIAAKSSRQFVPAEFEVGCDHLSYFGNAESLNALVKAIENIHQEV